MRRLAVFASGSGTNFEAIVTACEQGVLDAEVVLMVCDKPGAKVVVIEDLVSTGGSSLSAVEALQKAGCEVLGMVAIFTYGFPAAEKNFAEAGVRLDTLSNYNTMIEMAIEQGYVHADELETLKEWRRDPASWKK